MCMKINVTLPTIDKFLLLYSLRCGCKTILVWTLFRSLFCFLFFLTALLELFVHRSFPFGYVLIHDSHKESYLVSEDSFFFVYTSYIALLLAEAFLCVHVINLCTGLFYCESRLFVPYLMCRFITWIVENVFLLVLCLTHRLLIGWYLGMMVFVILEFYSYIVVYSYYDEILECERETCCKQQFDPVESCCM